MLALVFPGQGSQKPGFLSSWLEVPGFRDRLTWLSAVADIDLVAHGTESDEETIKDTAIAQPLLVASGILAADVLLGDGDRAGITAGHSVGEIAAAAFAGVLTAEQAMVFVRERGARMAAAAAEVPTGMSAVLGGEPNDVADTLARHGLTAANANGGGQTVAAGTLDELAALKDDPPAKARVMPLKVAGAFHTKHMAPAKERLSAISAGMSVADPSVPLLSNADGRTVNSGRDYLASLVTQVANPVRWDLCMETMAGAGVTGLLELPPAGTLSGLAKRGLKDVERFSLNSADDLDSAREFVARHIHPEDRS
ncbi:ACP S-malonyltransferase [Spelaeicoccus albus]|uniref:[acyl-carrier-protein] S-malonyltransferase n=1 Tax=Spelaeicoccus albus TaxID=1280376 RepID=A0A7Z0IIC6_9MICO|nr:ACP S-malonyltransferase [Spelaeicoccus albus]NYI68286.1 [acyl-carrier-protein] S-malonyltransferase [Spelaeicoccus albus]